MSIINNSKYVLCKFCMWSMNHKEIKYWILLFESIWNVYTAATKQMCKIKTGKKIKIRFYLWYCLDKFMGKTSLKLTKIYVNVKKIRIRVMCCFSWSQKFQWTLVLMVIRQHFCNTDIFNMNMKMVDYRAVIKRWQRLFCKSLRY